MDSVITTAVIGALANLSKDAIKDSYNGLKAMLKKKYGADSDVADAVDKLEKRPESEARKAAVQEECALAKVDNDPEIVAWAQALIEKIKEQPGGPELIQQTQNNIVGNVHVSGNFEFKPMQQGRKD